MKKSFGEKFNDFRKKKGLTQEQVAEKLNVSPQAVSKWENDLSYPDIELLVDIAKMFDASIDELLGEQIPETQVVPFDKRKNFNQMLLKVIISSKGGDKVKINLPLSIVKLGIEMGMQVPQFSGKDSLQKIDFEQIFQMIDKGVIGKLVEIESADGDIVEVFAE